MAFATTTIVLGAQFGDEGKGKLVDVLCEKADICARSCGGNNAGHTVITNGVTYEFHLIPSGLVYEHCTALLGSGMVIHLPAFFAELEDLKHKGLDISYRIFVSDRAHLVFDFYQKVDRLEEAELAGENVGTTHKGIGPTYAAKASRNGLRVADLEDWERFEGKYKMLLGGYEKRFEGLTHDAEEELERLKGYRERLQPLITDAVSFFSKAAGQKKKIVVEGANAQLLDLDYGTYPFVTSSSTGIGGTIAGLAISPFSIREILGVVKAYTTRVGSGPLPTELFDEVGSHLQEVGREFGVVTKRRRRCGWLDLVLVKYSALVNNYTSLNLTKLDVLDGLKEVKIAVGYEVDGETLGSFPADVSKLTRVVPVYKTFPGWPNTPTSKLATYNELPTEAKEYIEFIENFVGIKARSVGIGPNREHMLWK